MEFWYGLVGGLLVEIAGHWKLRHKPMPIYCASYYYWIVTGLMILSGGVLALFYAKSGVALSPLVAANIGASAPLIIGRLAGEAPKMPGVPRKK